MFVFDFQGLTRGCVRWECLYSSDTFAVSLATFIFIRRSPEDCPLPKLAPKGLFLPGNYPKGIHGLPQWTSPRNHSSNHPEGGEEENIQDPGRGLDDDKIPGLEALLGLGL